MVNEDGEWGKFRFYEYRDVDNHMLSETIRVPQTKARVTRAAQALDA